MSVSLIQASKQGTTIDNHIHVWQPEIECPRTMSKPISIQPHIL